MILFSSYFIITYVIDIINNLSFILNADNDNKGISLKLFKHTNIYRNIQK